ncbi:uncharacterized protein J3D65DRAFT_447803 [Phyllosticta citribraziliensis]|uniref:Uncharacterized protein n=1 Tax=Phyllosticta citribraziliensis TaxID=989973 RepID=A0ABR1LMY8_9PEZI
METRPNAWFLVSFSPVAMLTTRRIASLAATVAHFHLSPQTFPVLLQPCRLVSLATGRPQAMNVDVRHRGRHHRLCAIVVSTLTLEEPSLLARQSAPLPSVGARPWWRTLQALGVFPCVGTGDFEKSAQHQGASQVQYNAQGRARHLTDRAKAQKECKTRTISR